MSKILLKKVAVLPSDPTPHTVYFVRQDDDYVRLVVTDSSGQAKEVFNQALVEALIAENMPDSEIGKRLVASSPLGGHRVVILLSSDKIAYADATNISHANRVVGITTGAVSTNEEVYVQWGSEIEEPSWNWTPGDSIYVGANGVLTASTAGLSFVQRVGHAITPTKIFLKISEAILLG
jgi:hypothetical protein